jgi:hypothetical protein
MSTAVVAGPDRSEDGVCQGPFGPDDRPGTDVEEEGQVLDKLA